MEQLSTNGNNTLLKDSNPEEQQKSYLQRQCVL